MCIKQIDMGFKTLLSASYAYRTDDNRLLGQYQQQKEYLLKTQMAGIRNDRQATRIPCLQACGMSNKQYLLKTHAKQIIETVLVLSQHECQRNNETDMLLNKQKKNSNCPVPMTK